MHSPSVCAGLATRALRAMFPRLAPTKAPASALASLAPPTGPPSTPLETSCTSHACQDNAKVIVMLGCCGVQRQRWVVVECYSRVFPTATVHGPRFGWTFLPWPLAPLCVWLFRYESSAWVSNYDREQSPDSDIGWGNGPAINLSPAGWPQALSPRQHVGKLLARNVQLRVPAGVYVTVLARVAPCGLSHGATTAISHLLKHPAHLNRA